MPIEVATMLWDGPLFSSWHHCPVFSDVTSSKAALLLTKTWHSSPIKTIHINKSVSSLPGPTIQPAKVWSMSHKRNLLRAFFNPGWIYPKESSLQDQVGTEKANRENVYVPQTGKVFQNLLYPHRAKYLVSREVICNPKIIRRGTKA